jgi:hypothetical protein
MQRAGRWSGFRETECGLPTLAAVAQLVQVRACESGRIASSDEWP